MTTEKLKWFEFSQNNSGGYFVTDDKTSEWVFIQAADADEAIRRAEKFLDNSDSCECCGDRWSFWVRDEDGTDTPMIYGKPAAEHGSFWTEDFGRLHYANGRIEVLGAAK